MARGALWELAAGRRQAGVARPLLAAAGETARPAPLLFQAVDF